MRPGPPDLLGTRFRVLGCRVSGSGVGVLISLGSKV